MTLFIEEIEKPLLLVESTVNNRQQSHDNLYLFYVWANLWLIHLNLYILIHNFLYSDVYVYSYGCVLDNEIICEIILVVLVGCLFWKIPLIAFSNLKHSLVCHW